MYPYVHYLYNNLKNQHIVFGTIETNNLTAGIVGMASTAVADAAGIIEVQTVLSAMLVGFSGALGGLVAKYMANQLIKKINSHFKK